MKRLKLYETTIRTYVSKKDREDFRKIAYRNNMTISELARRMIKTVIATDKANKASIKQEELENDYNKESNYLGGIFYT